MNRTSGKDQLHEELLKYHELKTAWGLGHIECNINTCHMEECRARINFEQSTGLKNKHYFVYGRFLNVQDELDFTWLGNSLEDALSCVQFVKDRYLDL